MASALADALPAGWSGADVGTFTPAGTQTYTAANAGFDLTGAGTDIWNTADQFHYVYESWTGDGEWVVRVASLQNTDGWAKAGIMVRENLAVGSRHAMIVLTPANGVSFQRRKVTDGTSLSTTRNGSTAPGWLKLVRKGNQFDAYTSSDGLSWTYWTTDVVEMPAGLLVGLAVTSHHGGVAASASFTQFGATPPLPENFPSGWTSQDIGAPALAGSGDYRAESGLLTIRGAGTDIWGTGDQFQFTSRPWTGDAVVIVRVDSLRNTNLWAKAGVMIRAGLTAGSRHALVALTPGNGAVFQRRTTDGGISLNTAASSVTVPAWVKIERWGDRFDAYYSIDGLTWKYLGTETIVMPATVYIGLAVTSHADTSLTEAVFSHFDYHTTGVPGGLWGEYFSGKAFNTSVFKRLDGVVDFSWGAGSPAAVVPVDGFSARWTGSVTPDVTQNYTFYTQSDDGVRLWINGQLLIDNWTDHGNTENSATVALAAGTAYSVKMEYYENAGNAIARLLWSAADRGKAPVAAVYLTPSQYPDTDNDGLPDYWEKLHGLDPANPADASLVDPQGQGLTYIQEYMMATHPDSTDTDGDGVADIADPYPLDYYNAVAPLVTIVGGDNQSAAPGAFNVSPFDVAVWKNDGSGPLVNAPVTFTVTSGGGLLSANATGAASLSASATLHTDAEGTARVYYQQPLMPGVTGAILATAGSAQVTFHSVSRVSGSLLMAGGDQSLWIDSSGVARAWGRNVVGQLGDGTAGNRAQMMKVVAISGPLASAACGESHGLAVTKSGQVYAWGDNEFGQLGDGTRVQRRSPVLVAGLPTAVQVAAGDHHSFALSSDGTVWSWGGNQHGQLGDGTTRSSLQPEQIAGLAGIVSIVAGAEHGAALDGQGRVWAWGSNAFGQLADASVAERDFPAMVAGLDQVTALVSGRQHLLALSKDGSVKAWGANEAGQLGLGTTAGQTVPATIPGLTGIQSLASGGSHSLALSGGGLLWTWGSNDTGQAGVGSASAAFATPASLALSGVSVIAVGRDHAFVLKTDGTLLSWGFNQYGQLGDPAAGAFTSTPITVAPARD